MEQQQLKHLQFALSCPVCLIHDTYHAQNRAFVDCPILSLSVTTVISRMSELGLENQIYTTNLTGNSTT